MDDYEALLNRVAKQLAYSGFASRRHSRSSSTLPQTTCDPASRIHKPASGRNSPARHSSYNRSLVVGEQHSTPLSMPLPNANTQSFVASWEAQAPEPTRPHSWHQSGLNPQFSDPDYSLNPSSSSFPDTTFDWALMQASDLNTSHHHDQICLEDWTTPPDLASMDQNGYFNNANEFDFGPSLDPFDIYSASTGQQPIDSEADKSLPQLRVSDNTFGPSPPLPLDFDAYYGPVTQSMSQLDMPLLPGAAEFTADDSELTAVINQGFGPSQFKQQMLASPDVELIGLGLYDKAEDTARQTQQLTRQHPGILFGDLVPPTGKGLKLEETWQPPDQGIVTLDDYGEEADDNDYDDDDDDDDDDDQNDEAYYEQQLITPIDAVPYASFPLNLSEEQYLYGDVDGLSNGVMESQQKELHTQETYEHGWFEQNGSLPFM